MDLYEYQGKKFLADYGIAVPKGVVVSTPDALPEMKEGGVVKAQVLTGGRGKAGGVAVCNNNQEIQEAAKRILGLSIKGFETRQILVEGKVAIDRELYISFLINRKNKVPSILFSDQGGMDIESVDKKNMVMVDVNPLIGLKGYKVKELLAPFDLPDKDKLTELIFKAWRLFSEKKLMLLEINPLVLTKDGEYMALDAKISMDDWAIDPSITPETQVGGDKTEFEQYMQSHKASAVEMDGDVVVYAAGAGTSMATADCIKKRGASLRAIIDEGGFNPTLTTEGHREYAAEVLRNLSMLKPKVILINTHYQAGRLDLAAETYKLAFSELCKEIPIVIRLKGRCAEEAIECLKDTGIYVTGSFSEACDVAVSKLSGDKAEG